MAYRLQFLFGIVVAFFAGASTSVEIEDCSGGACKSSSSSGTHLLQATTHAGRTSVDAHAEEACENFCTGEIEKLQKKGKFKGFEDEICSPREGVCNGCAACKPTTAPAPAPVEDEAPGPDTEPEEGADPCSPTQRLSFRNAPARNNLGNSGPDAGEEGLLFEDVLPDSGGKVNLLVNAAAGYERDQDRSNGIKGNVAKINLKTGGKADLTMTFLDGETGEPKAVGPFYISFLDFDESKHEGKARESVTVENFDSYKVTDTTLVHTQANAENVVVFSSTTHGTGADNAADINDLSAEQLDKSASVLFPSLESFRVVFEVADLSGKGNNRFIQFVGVTNLVCAAPVLFGKGKGKAKAKPKAKAKAKAKPDAKDKAKAKS